VENFRVFPGGQAREPVHPDPPALRRAAAVPCKPGGLRVPCINNLSSAAGFSKRTHFTEQFWACKFSQCV